MCKKLKVAIVAPANNPGGQAAQAAFLTRRWANDSELDVSLVASDPRFPKVLSLLERTPYLRTIIRFLLYMATIWRQLGQADIVHVFSASYWSLVLVPLPAYFVARARKAKIVLNYHSGEAPDHLAHWRSAHWLLRRVDAIAVPSQYLAQVFAQHGYVTVVVPNGIDDAHFRYRQRDVLQPHMLCTRAFEPYYRIDLVVRAFAQVKAQIPEASLTLVGSGGQEQSLRELVRNLALTGVVFAGAVDNTEIGAYYDAADVWLNASVVDNMPVSILEAFASGCVVISSASGGIPFMVEDDLTGLLSAPEDVNAMAANIVRVLRTPRLGAKLSQAAFENSDRYRWDVLRKSWLGLYRKLEGADAGVTKAPVNALITK
jgi:glycosyltransferase involved in cell wall biosynthesis